MNHHFLVGFFGVLLGLGSVFSTPVRLWGINFSAAWKGGVRYLL